MTTSSRPVTCDEYEQALAHALARLLVADYLKNRPEDAEQTDEEETRMRSEEQLAGQRR